MKTKLFPLLLTALMFASCTGMVQKIVHMAKQHEDLSDVAPADTVNVTKQKTFDQPFTKIMLTGAYDLEIIQGDSTISLTYKGRKVYWDNTKFEIRGGQLFVGSDTESYARGKLYLTLPTITNVEVAGASEVEIENFNQSEDLDIMIAGAGDIDIKSARFGNVNLSISGAGDIETQSLTCNNLTATISGAGDMEIERINAANVTLSISGSGDIKASGHCKTFSNNVSGAGEIDTEDLVVTGKRE